MLNDFNCSCPVYIACGYTDLRRGIDGLAGLVQAQFQTEDIPTEVTEHRIPEFELVCPECGDTMVEIGKEVTRRLKFIPAVVIEDWY